MITEIKGSDLPLEAKYGKVEKWMEIPWRILEVQ